MQVSRAAAYKQQLHTGTPPTCYSTHFKQVVSTNSPSSFHRSGNFTRRLTSKFYWFFFLPDLSNSIATVCRITTILPNGLSLHHLCDIAGAMLWDGVQPHNRLNHIWPRCLRKALLIQEDTGMPRDFYIGPWGFTSRALAAKHSLRLKIKDAFHLQRVRFAFSSRADLQSSAERDVGVSWNYSGIVQWTKMFPCHSCRILLVLNMLALNEHAKVSKIKANPKASLLGFSYF